MSTFFILLFCIFMFIPMTIIVYLLLPAFLFKIRFYKNSAGHNSMDENHLVVAFSKIPVPEKLKRHLISKLYESGIGDHNTWIYWIMITLLLPAAIYIIMTLQNYPCGMKISICFLCITLPNIYINNKIKKRKRIFVINAYKIYYFLHSQISSGIKVTDAIKGLYEIADHPLIQKSFVQFVAKYELTLDIDESLDILRKSFPGYDCEMLCISIQQSINTGMAGKTLLKMEQLMFAKYFYYLQKSTEEFKTKIFISGVFAIIPLVMIFLFPVIFDAFKSFELIMQTS